jgi:hypothetical protein
LVCESSIDPYLVEYRAGEDLIHDRAIWTVEGEAGTLPAIIQYGQVPIGWKSRFGPDRAQAKDAVVSVTVTGTRATKVGSFHLENLHSGEWMTPDGHYFSGDCESAPE